MHALQCNLPHACSAGIFVFLKICIRVAAPAVVVTRGDAVTAHGKPNSNGVYLDNAGGDEIAGMQEIHLMLH